VFCSSDFTTFEPSIGTPSLLDEPEIKAIAAKQKKSPAQVILRWHAQQKIPTNPRTTNTSHMAENLDVFDW
jgi:diketogulonate reductase-like aldo/keto reductase